MSGNGKSVRLLSRLTAEQYDARRRCRRSRRRWLWLALMAWFIAAATFVTYIIQQ